MRKLVLIFAVLAILPIAAFADWGVGGAVFYKSPVGFYVQTSSGLLGVQVLFWM